MHDLAGARVRVGLAIAAKKVVQRRQAYAGTQMMGADDQGLVDIAAPADPIEGIRKGLGDVKAGNLRLAKEFFDEFEAFHGLSG